MKKCIIRIGLFLLIVASTTGALAQSSQVTNKVSAEKKGLTQTNDTSNAEKPPKPGPFHGKLASVDKVAKTITVGKRTFQITSETKIKKAGKPATLEDGVVGDAVSGYVKPTNDGKLVATTVSFGPKAASDASEKQKAPSEKGKQGTEKEKQIN